MQVSVRYLWCLLTLILLIRLLTLDLYPLMDTTEARYGEMARKMVELGNWITPMFDYEQPFWGKPPLSFWTQALGITVFGVNEFAVRLSSWLFSLGSCVLLIRWGREEAGLETGLLAAVIYASTVLGFVVAGAVLTDPALGFAVLLAFYGFWRGIRYREPVWACIGYAGLGLGLLAKGPLILVLFGCPALLWIVVTRQWHRLAQLPWLWGLLVLAVVAVPWYILAELRTPGFLDYFLVGEHWHRYTVSGWEGDRYGSAHARPVGTIWLYFIGAILPWGIFALVLRKDSKGVQRHKSLVALLAIWLLFTPVFFTLSRNILSTYVLPVLPAFALLLSLIAADRILARKGLVITSGMFAPLVFLALLIEGSAVDSWKNQRQVIAKWQNLSAAQIPIFYLGKRIYSAEFYSAGRSQVMQSDGPPAGVTKYYLAAREKELSRLGLPEHAECRSEGVISETHLFYCRQLSSSYSSATPPAHAH